MKKELIYRYIPLATLFTAMGIIFPIFFHLVGLGSAFLPMFLPIIMAITRVCRLLIATSSNNEMENAYSKHITKTRIHGWRNCSLPAPKAILKRFAV